MVRPVPPSGGVLNWANGDVTLTHSTGALTTTGNLSINKANPTIIVNKVCVGRLEFHRRPDQWAQPLGN